jgi:hypothetical protein
MIGAVGGIDFGSLFGSAMRGPFFDGAVVGADFFAIGAILGFACGCGFFPLDRLLLPATGLASFRIGLLSSFFTTGPVDIINADLPLDLDLTGETSLPFPCLPITPHYRQVQSMLAIAFLF